MFDVQAYLWFVGDDNVQMRLTPHFLLEIS